MADGWSRHEVEATVADYFAMLDEEVRQVPYNKSEHRRSLARLLDGRSDGAIERKHQNISAILIELGFVYLAGYRPLSNYQQLLFDVVSERLESNHALVALVGQEVREPACIPTVDDILATLTDPPVQEPDTRRYRKTATRERQVVRKDVDYLALEAGNRSLGAAGEEFVVRFEIARLERAGASRLAAQVERVSATRGDGLGFDVLSFESTGEERLIEVKTTAYGVFTPFFVTTNEVDVSRERGEQFHLYRPFSFRRQPRMYMKRGPIEHAFALAPSQFKATVL